MTTQAGKDTIKLIGDKIKGIRIAMMAKESVTGSQNPLGENQKVKFD